MKEALIKTIEVYEKLGLYWNLNDLMKEISQLGYKYNKLKDGLGEFNIGNEIDVRVYHEENEVFLLETVFLQRDVVNLDIMEYDDAVREYFQLYNDCVGYVKSNLNKKPNFDNGMAAKGFPDDQDAVWLSLWKMKWGRIMVANKHEGMEFPIRIVSMAAPK